jgi:hypothetical protein
VLVVLFQADTRRILIVGFYDLREELLGRVQNHYNNGTERIEEATWWFTIMLETYSAILHNNRIEWTGDAPAQLPPDRAVPVHVTLLDRAAAVDPEQGRRMAAALERLAARNALSEIVDPTAWERETRQDRLTLDET